MLLLPHSSPITRRLWNSPESELFLSEFYHWSSGTFSKYNTSALGNLNAATMLSLFFSTQSQQIPDELKKCQVTCYPKPLQPQYLVQKRLICKLEGSWHLFLQPPVDQTPNPVNTTRSFLPWGLCITELTD